MFIFMFLHQQTERRGEGGQGRGGREGREASVRAGEPEGKRRSIMRPSLPNATLARARALFVFVVHTMNAMSGAMQLSRWQTSVVMELPRSCDFAKFTLPARTDVTVFTPPQLLRGGQRESLSGACTQLEQRNPTFACAVHGPGSGATMRGTFRAVLISVLVPLWRPPVAPPTQRPYVPRHHCTHSPCCVTKFVQTRCLPNPDLPPS